MCLGTGPYFRSRIPDRDGSRGLLIAPGIFCWFVPGSPAEDHLGGRELPLKTVRAQFELLGKSLERWGQVGIDRHCAVGRCCGVC